MTYVRVIDVSKVSSSEKRHLPLFVSAVSAGAPFSADSTIDQSIDLNEFFIKNPTSTFFVRVEGTSMINAGIHHEDILIVDKSLDPLPNNIVIAVVDGEFLVKRLITECEERYLVPDNPDFGRIEISKNSQAEIWGVVVWVIHKVGNRI